MREADAFDEFYRGTRDRLLAYLYAAGGDLAEAQDAAQEAYARAWQRWADVGGYDDPEAWVRTVGWRILASRWRKVRGQARAYRRHGPLLQLCAPGRGPGWAADVRRRLLTPVERPRPGPALTMRPSSPNRCLPGTA